MHQSMLSRREGGWRAGVGILTFCPKFFQKPLPRDNVFCQKNTKIPTQRQGSYVKCSYPEAMLFILGIHHDQTRQKNCTSLSLRKQKSFFQSIPRNQIVINTKTQLMREEEANILLLLNGIKCNMPSFHSSDVGQTVRPREREKSNIRTLRRVHKVKSHSLGHECLIKIPTPAPPPPPHGITLIGT